MKFQQVSPIQGGPKLSKIVLHTSYTHISILTQSQRVKLNNLFKKKIMTFYLLNFFTFNICVFLFSTVLFPLVSLNFFFLLSSPLYSLSFSSVLPPFLFCTPPLCLSLFSLQSLLYDLCVFLLSSSLFVFLPVLSLLLL